MAAYIGIDWGTSNFRAYLCSKDGSVLDHRSSDKGIKKLNPSEFEPYLLEQISAWQQTPPLPVILCGMVGSQAGWQEAPYIPITDINHKLDSSIVKVQTKNEKLKAYIIGGAYQDDPANVMRGEETQIFGFLKQEKDFSGYIILPGTHSKWVHVKASQCLSFKTFITGELYAMLGQYSILSSMLNTDKTFHLSRFYDGLQEAIKKPSALTSLLFSIRAQALLKKVSDKNWASYLSGLLIAQEFLPLYQNKEKPKRLLFIGNSQLTDIYQKASQFFDLPSHIYNAETATISGLHHCITNLQKG